ncbi:MAG: acyl-CoA thioesterase [Treponema sp.]|nr:acyl-CoA thioesterase [Treponema sp.]
MAEKKIENDTIIRIEFYDVDSMDVAWHGNYVKFMEVARCEILNKIGYGYSQMRETGYIFPVVTLKIKYVRSLFFGQKVRIHTTLEEYENRLKLKYEFYDDESGKLATKAESVQMAVRASDKATLFECPACFTDKVKALLDA